MAGIRAEARAGYSVDGCHEWSLDGHHSMYIRPSEARMAIQTLFLEDVMDAVRIPQERKMRLYLQAND
jgi:hypothetical protein